MELISPCRRTWRNGCSCLYTISKSPCFIIENWVSWCHTALRPYLSQTYQAQLRDSLQTDIQILTALVEDENETQMVAVTKLAHVFPTELCLTFQRSQIDTASSGHFVSDISIQGLTFSTFSKNRGNACVLIREPNDMIPMPAEVVHIIEILEEGTSKTYLAVRRLEPVALHHDPFSRYPALRTRLWKRRLSDLDVVVPSQILSHCARLPIRIGQEKYFAVLSLCRGLDCSYIYNILVVQWQGCLWYN